jgi:hypothetical protein
VIFGDIVDTDSNVSVKIADHQTAKEESSPDFISHFDPGSVPRQSVRGPETELRPRFESSERGASLSKEADASQLKRANECLLEALYIEKKERERLETKLLASKVL